MSCHLPRNGLAWLIAASFHPGGLRDGPRPELL
jgi:hypothetical protein